MANKIEKQFLDTENKGPVRLNKYLSEAGVCSRSGSGQTDSSRTGDG